LAFGQDAPSYVMVKLVSSPHRKMRKRTKTARRLEDFPLEEREILEAVMRSTGKSLEVLDPPLILKQARAIDKK
jgi:hypothetical protein